VADYGISEDEPPALQQECVTYIDCFYDERYYKHPLTIEKHILPRCNEFCSWPHFIEENFKAFFSFMSVLKPLSL
jgi:hypothetical protein